MTKDDIISLPHVHLRQKSTKVMTIDDEIIRHIEDMTEAALDWEASRPHEISAALAAVQVDIQKRIIIVRSDFEYKESKEFTTFINPEIVKYEGEITEDYEGCLSVKDIYGKVGRHSKVRVKAMTVDGKEVRFKAEGFLARVIQHEIDHTQGVVFIDHIKEKQDAFYKLDENGELEPLDYDTHIKNNKDLWSD